MIRVFVVARSPVVRAGLEAMLRDRYTIAGAATSLDETAQADVILADVEPDAEGLESEAPSVFLLDSTQAAWAAESLRSQPRALLPKDTGEAEVAAAVDAVAAGLTVIHPEFLHLLTPATAASREAGIEAGQPLSPREIEVLRMLAEGLPNKTIAWKLGISEHTVKFHVASIFSKLNVGSRTEAVTAGLRQGLILL